MITSSTSVRSAARAPEPDLPPTGYESPSQARDGGWLGQVPPPVGPAAPPKLACTAVTDALDAQATIREREDAGWLGQVPPSAGPCPEPEPSRAEDPPVTGFESPDEARENGWLGQVPPPTPPAHAPVSPRGDTPTFANPQLAPDPWNDPGTLYPSDPTLFG